MKFWILDDEGKEVETDYLTWAKWFEDVSQRRIALDTRGEVRVSTIFLGFDHGFHSDGPPVLYETMILGDGRRNEYQRRYCTREEALIGHAKAVIMAFGDQGET